MKSLKRPWVWIGIAWLIAGVLFALSRVGTIRAIQSLTNAVPDVLRVGETTVCVPQTWFLTAKRERKETPALLYGFLPENWVSIIGIDTHLPSKIFFFFQTNAEDKKLGVLISELESSRVSRLSQYLGNAASRAESSKNSKGCSLKEITVSGILGITLQCPWQNNNELETIEFPSIHLVISASTSELQRLNEIRFGCGSGAAATAPSR